ncbi:MAG: hypothetical protein H0W83_09700, partial [Planctomycetes bacterium]|nr:hypothetical protein [Planctomycetota bacterium]
RRLLYLAAAKRLHERCAALESMPHLAPRLAPRLPTEARRRSPTPNRTTSQRLPRLPAKADQDATPVAGSALV